MGYSLSWLAIKTDDESKLLDSLSLDKTGETGDFGDSLLVGRLLFPDWYLMVVDERTLYREHKKFDFFLFGNEYLEKLSREHSLVSCTVNETSMYSRCALWDEGKQTFLVEHGGDMEGSYHLEQSGVAPEIFEGIKKKYFDKQDEAGGNEADVDYIFEIPTVLAQEITGFKHDVMDSLESPVYDFLSFEWPEPESKKAEANEAELRRAELKKQYQDKRRQESLDKFRSLLAEREELEARGGLTSAGKKPWWKFW